MLFAALIGPYLVDWTAYRDRFEREAAAYIGRPVTIAGKASVRLLPTPVLSFTDITVGDAGAPEARIERFRAEVELAPLLKGEVRVIQMSVERPRFQLDLAGLGDGLESGERGGWRIDGERVSLARLEILDGTAKLSDSRGGRSWDVAGLDAVVEAGSLRGPARISADFSLENVPYHVQAALGRLDPADTVTAKLTVASPLHPLTLSADGTLSLAAGAPPSYVGTATLEGIEPAEEHEGEHEEERSPWTDFRLAGAFELTPAALAVSEAQISYGATERPLVVQAAGRMELGQAPRLDLALNARQIDIDQALGGSPETPVAIGDALAALTAALPTLPPLPVPAALRLEAQGLVVGGSVIQAVEADLATEPGGWQVRSLSALLPGETRLEFAGKVAADGALSLSGRGRLASERPPAFSAWWRGRVGSAGNLDSFAVEADLDLRPERQQLTDLVAMTAGGRVTGSVDLRRFQQSDQIFAAVTLAAERADLVEARALGELLVGDTLARGQIDQLTLSMQAGILSAGGIEARDVALESELEGGRVNVRRFAVGDLAGAALEATAQVEDPFGRPAGRIDASVKAHDLTGAAEFLAEILPENRAVAHLREAVPILSPLEAEFSAESSAADEAVSVELTGSFAETHLRAIASGKGSWLRPAEANGTLTLHVDGGDSARVLTQLGLRPLPVQAGPLSLDASFEGSPPAGRLEATGSVAGIGFAYRGEAGLRQDGPFLAGELDANTADVDPALLLAGFAVPGLGEGHAAAAKGKLDLADGELALVLAEGSFDTEPVAGSLRARLGPALRLSGALDLKTLSLPVLASLGVGDVPGFQSGAWSDTPFARALPPGISLDLALAAETLDIGLPAPAARARMRFGLDGETLNLDLAEAEYAGGKLKGTIAGTLREGEADLALRGALQGGQLQALVWERNGLPVASGLIDGSFDLAGHGRSMAGLVSSLAGTGSFAVSDGRINALNPQALQAVMDEAEAAGEPDEQQARETFAIHFGSGALAFGRAAGSFSAAGGVLSLATVSVAAAGTTVLAEASIDLNDLTLGSEWTVRAGAGSAGAAEPQVRVAFSGGIGDPERRIDLGPLLDLLRSRHLQRQLDELERLEEARRQSEARQRAAEALEASRPAPAAAPAPEAAAPPPQAPSAPPAPDAAPPLDLLPRDDAARNPLAVPSLLAPI